MMPYIEKKKRISAGEYRNRLFEDIKKISESIPGFKEITDKIPDLTEIMEKKPIRLKQIGEKDLESILSKGKKCVLTNKIFLACICYVETKEIRSIIQSKSKNAFETDAKIFELMRGISAYKLSYHEEDTHNFYSVTVKIENTMDLRDGMGVSMITEKEALLAIQKSYEQEQKMPFI